MVQSDRDGKPYVEFSGYRWHLFLNHRAAAAAKKNGTSAPRPPLGALVDVEGPRHGFIYVRKGLFGPLFIGVPAFRQTSEAFAQADTPR